MARDTTHTYLAVDDSLSKIDQVIKTFCDTPRSQLRAFFTNECVTLNGKLCTNPGTPIKKGDRVVFCYQAERRYRDKKQINKPIGYSVVFEDGHLIVVNKDAGLLTVSTRNCEPDTLLSRINAFLPSGINANTVHRLDRDTSGLLVFAKSMGITVKLKEQFKRRKPERVYDAFVRGRLKNKQGTFRSFLATDQDLNQYSVDDEKEAKLAITHYTVHRELPDVTWVKVRLETGRRNQIRVHFAEKLNPVIGDVRYQPQLAQHALWQSEYLALHATTLGFDHPAKKKSMLFQSELPDRMRQFLTAVL